MATTQARDPLAAYDDVFEAASKEWNVDPALLKAVARQESGGDVRAISPAGAHGLMQIMPKTQRDLGVTDPFDPVQSIFAGAKYLNEALDAEGSPDRALLYYHGGPGWRNSYGPESRGYVPAVSAHYAAYKGSGGTPATATAAPAPPARPAATRPAAPASAPIAPTVDDLHKAFDEPAGATPKPGAPAAKATPGDEDLNAAFGPPAGSTPNLRPPPSEAATPTPPTVGVDEYGRELGPGGFPVGDSPLSPSKDTAKQVVESLSSDQGIRTALAPAPNTTYGQVLPYGQDDKTGELRFALPSSIRDTARDLYDLSQSPATGGITPAQTATMLQIAALRGPESGYRFSTINRELPGSPGLAPFTSVRGELDPAKWTSSSGLKPGDTALGRNEVPDLLGREFRVSPTASGNALAPSGTGPSEPNPLAPKAAAPITVPQPAEPAPAAGPQPGMGGPQTQSVGAAASRQGTPASEIGLTPEETAAHRYTADKQWLMKSLTPGEAITTEHIPGINPTAAQQEQTAVRAREMKAVRNLSPEVAQEERELLSHHNDKRKDFYADTAGSEVTRGRDLSAVEQKIDDDLKTVWQNKKTADAQPIADAASAELDGSAGLLPPVRDVVKQITDAVTKPDGSLKTDPQQLYQARRLINYMQSKAGRAQNPGYGSADVQASLVRMKDAVDKAIEPAAPGFGKAISDYAEARGPIDAAEALQAREGGLLDSQGRMQYSKVHNLLRDIIEAQKPGASPTALSHVSEAQLTRLKALHDDLQRVASAEDLARASGSDSVANAADAVKTVAKLGARGVAHWAANQVAPGVGSLAVESALQGASRLWEPFRAARAERGLRRRGQELLYPKPPPSPNALGPD